MAQTKILSENEERLKDAIRLTLRDILMNDVLTETEMGASCGIRNDPEDVCKTNLYMDRAENVGSFVFNLNINGEPAADNCLGYWMALVPGRANDKGLPEMYITGELIQSRPSTIVKFTLPTEDFDNIFSEHKDGYSYSNYALYGMTSTPPQPPVPSKTNNPGEQTSNILFSKGKIYRTDIITDYVENNG